MEGMDSITSYQQSIEELQHSLLFTTMELESVQFAVKEEKKRNEEKTKQLLQLLQTAFHERDEAKDNLRKLLNKLTQSGSSQLFHVLPNVQSEVPTVLPTKHNSNIVESDSLSETYNLHSHISSSVESYFDAVSSPELSNINMADSSNMEVLQQPFLQEYNSHSSVGTSSVMGQIDPASALIERLVKGKTRPEKGRLLQAVVDAGPLLQTLLLAGPLPQWHNPPPLQALQIPPISIKGHDPAAFIQKPFVNSNHHVHSSLIAPHQETSIGNSQTCSRSMLSFSSIGGSCMNKRSASSYESGNNLVHSSSLFLNAKHRRVQ
ncbi:hypothetical protein AAC387_Pa03g2614 [Persea americana]